MRKLRLFFKLFDPYGECQYGSYIVEVPISAIPVIQYGHADEDIKLPEIIGGEWLKRTMVPPKEWREYHSTSTKSGPQEGRE